MMPWLYLQWPYSEFVSIVPNVKAPANNEFIITMKKGIKKTDSMKFSTDHRADLLTEALVCFELDVLDNFLFVLLLKKEDIVEKQTAHGNACTH